MLDAQSPLGPMAQFETGGIKLSENAGFVLTQVAGDEKAIKKQLGKLPSKVGVVLQQDVRSICRIGPSQFWLLGETISPSEGVYITPLSSSRTRIMLEGDRARQLLAAVALIDFHESAFKPGQFVMTGIHHTPVTIVCVSDTLFHIYTLRTFARSVWDWLCDLSEGLNHA